MEATFFNNLFFCTSLRITDKNNKYYHGRTLEFSTDKIPSFVCYLPKNKKYQHIAPDNSLGYGYSSKYNVLGVGFKVENNGEGLDHQLGEGLNCQGLSFSLNMKTNSDLPELAQGDFTKSIPFDAFGHWAISNFATVDEVREGMKNVAFWSRGVSELPGVKSPFHFAVYDKNGGSIVVEASNDQLFVHDNPTGVVANGPEFTWHLTNLNNYSHLTNRDVNEGRLGNMNLRQPDAGISSASLPASDTAVGRFVRAVFYSTFVKQVDTPAQAIIELSHVMNRFDRPKDINISVVSEDGTKSDVTTTEFTVWTTLKDIENGTMYIRGYDQLNYIKYTLEQYKDQTEEVIILV